MLRWQHCVALIGTLALGACAVAPPTGPSIAVMPASGKNLAEFQSDDMACRQYATQVSGGASPAAAAQQSQVNSAALGTVLGAAAGAAIGAAAGNPAAGAAIGAAAAFSSARPRAAQARPDIPARCSGNTISAMRNAWRRRATACRRSPRRLPTRRRPTPTRIPILTPTPLTGRAITAASTARSSASAGAGRRLAPLALSRRGAPAARIR